MARRIENESMCEHGKAQKTLCLLKLQVWGVEQNENHNSDLQTIQWNARGPNI